MARRTGLSGKLTDLQIKAVNNTGLISDGNGLYLRTSRSGTKSFIYRYRDITGRLRDMGLGGYPKVSLGAARAAAVASQQARGGGIDPIAQKAEKKRLAKLEAGRNITFKTFAEEFISKRAWGNAKHAKQWPSSMRMYVYPEFGDTSIKDIDRAMIMRVLDPIWLLKKETARRVRQRIEVILQSAIAAGYHSGPNPAAWQTSLAPSLQKHVKARHVVHHPALPFKELGALMEALSAQDGIASAALRFTILTTARTGEAIGAQWDEIDFENKVWNVPKARMTDFAARIFWPWRPTLD